MKSPILSLGLVLLSALSWAEAAPPNESPLTPLPEPLSLHEALASINHHHPLLLAAQADAALSQGELMRARADDDLRIDLSLEGRHIEPSDLSPNQDPNDSRAVLTAHKTLYDFGRTAHAKQAAELELGASEQQHALQIQSHRQLTIERYLKVLLADLTFDWRNEAMALSYVRLDNARERHSLGALSDVDLLALESTYQGDLLLRQRAELSQRQTRTRLALALGRPEELSSELLPPELPGIKNPLPELSALLNEARTQHLGLKALRNRLAASEAQRKAASATRYPSLYAQLEAAEYEREFGSRDPFTAILGLNIPLYQGERVGARTATAAAQRQAIRSMMLAEEYRLNEQVLSLYQQIEALMAQLEQAEVQAEFRDLYLDRSRAQYDLEMKTDLGDAMVAQTYARRFSAETRFDLALAREQLAILTQNPAYSALQAAVDTEDSP